MTRDKSSNPRVVAFELLAAVEQRDAYANLLMPKLLSASGMSDQDRAFAQELAFGVLRNLGRYHAIIELASRRKLADLDAELLQVLSIGAHQLFSMRVADHAAIFETVELAKRVLPTRLTPLVNAVLRRVSEASSDIWLDRITSELRSDDERLAVSYSHPRWIIAAFREALSLDGCEEELVALLDLDNEPPKVSLVALPGRCRREEVAGLDTGGVGASPIGGTIASGDPYQLPEVRDNRARVQDQGSQLAALALIAAAPVKATESWLDMCAGPGGKAAVLAAVAAMEGPAFYANEPTPHRLKLVRAALSGLEVPEGRLLAVDGSDAAAVRVASGVESFDRILLDAPCTGLGALRRRPEARWRKSPEDLKGLVALQRKLLRSAVELLSPGGTLAYVTCSPHPMEANAQIAWLLKEFAGRVELMDAVKVLHELNPELKLNRNRRTVQLWPQKHGTDAMFIALLRNLG